ncbi:MAG: thioredoxin family protein [Vibrionaceae bacterium]|nr:thioredoxin family protein [Vibrionaceae bacterium]
MNRILNIKLFKQLVGLITLVLLIGFSSLSVATETGWMSNPQHPPVQTRFVITGQSNSAQPSVEGFLEVKLGEGWKTYWRNPGEGGVAPKIDWSGSTNLKDVQWHWPFPQRFDLLGISTLGYKDDVVIPMTLTLQDWRRPVELSAKLTLSSCDTVCVLTDYPFSLTFTPSQLAVSETDAYRYAQAISLVPKGTAQISASEATWDQQNKLLSVKLSKALPWQSPELIVDSFDSRGKEYSFTPLTTQLDNGAVSVTFRVSSWMNDINLNQIPLRVSVKDEGLLAEVELQARAGVIDSYNGSLLMMLGFAFIGGLILNIMPCVLPVLGMKLSSVISAHGFKRTQIRRQFLSSSAGILCSFWLLAGFLWILKLTGNTVGWGIQFQSGWFIGLMVLVTGLFGANMLGLFHISLPARMTTWLAARGDESQLGHFTQGMFATLLATPCSAPFLGTAVAFALAASSVELFVIFTALGLGMAFPWLLVSAFPRLATLLPKPGAWVNKVKSLFGLMMFGTSLWLLTLLTNHLPVFWVVVIALVALVLLLKAIKRVYGDKMFVLSGGFLMMTLAGSLILGSMTTDKWVTPLPDDLVWRTLDQSAISTAVSAGKTVFVNVTADWCVTCQANKVGVILQDPVYSTLKLDSVVAMQGDWTHPDSEVSRYLRENGRFGVPFNIVYGPAAPEGIPLPVILNDKSVIQAIDVASGGAGS